MTFRILTLIAVFLCMPALAAEQTQPKDRIYEQPTLKKISHMYWRLSKFDIEDNDAVDNFLRINECEIYKDYHHNEFEWRNVRLGGKSFIEKGRAEFPLRFNFVQPLSLGEYDFERKGFHVLDADKINNVRRFEVYSDDVDTRICGTNKPIPGYPRALLLALSRPLTFDFVPMDEERASALMKEKLQGFKNLRDEHQTKRNLRAFRNAVMVMKVKLFAYKPEDRLSQHGFYLANVLGVLEGIEIYESRDKQKLLHSEEYRRRKGISKFEQDIKKKYELRKLKLKGKTNN